MTVSLNVWQEPFGKDEVKYFFPPFATICVCCACSMVGIVLAMHQTDKCVTETDEEEPVIHLHTQDDGTVHAVICSLHYVPKMFFLYCVKKWITTLFVSLAMLSLSIFLRILFGTYRKFCSYPTTTVKHLNLNSLTKSCWLCPLFLSKYLAVNP